MAIARSGGLAAALFWTGVLGGSPMALAAQDAATLTGTVLDEITREPISGATVAVIGLNRPVTTDDFGQFLVEGVEPGLTWIRFSRDGYVAVQERMEVSETDFLQVWLRPVAVALDELLVIADEPETRVRSEASTRTALDILADDIPGVMVRRGGGGPGAGAAIAIRGVGTFRDSAPDILLDGIRINDSSGSSTALHSLDLIPAETVARIRVYKGPSATVSFAYGANGVIVIETVRGPRGSGGA